MNNKTIIIYGAGELGKLASEFFDFYKIDYMVCDDNPENYKDDKFWERFIIVKPEDIAKCYQILVCISTASYNMIKDKLNDMGFDKVLPFFQYAEQVQKKYDYKHPLTNGWIKTSWKESDENRCDKIANTFEDKQSLWHYYSFIHWHQFSTEFIYPEQIINCNNRYFIPEVVSVMHDHEVFVDIGAYHGRVSKKFMQIVQNQYEEIHCFEPDLNNSFKLFEPDLNNSFKLFEKFKIEHPKISLYDIALGNKKGYINFLTGKGYCSKIWKQSKQKEIINKFDNIVELNDIKPTFIKIHTEGSELGVLKGAIKTIKQYRPIIAVTTYHTEDGLYKIPLYLMNRLTNYRFYWRNHNYQGQGSVLYCVPRERYNK
jgi:FkbM family methyltransferase